MIWSRAMALLFVAFAVSAFVVQVAAEGSPRVGVPRLIAGAAGAAVQAAIVAAIVRRRAAR